MNETTNFTILITKELVLFPSVTIDIEVGRDFSLNAINESLKQHEGKIAVVTQIDSDIEQPEAYDFFHVGTLCNIDSFDTSKKNKNAYKVRLTGIKRVYLSNVLHLYPNDENNVFTADASEIVEIPANPKSEEKLMMRLVDELMRITEWIKLPKNFVQQFKVGINAGTLCDQLAMTLDIDTTTKQQLLEERSVKERLEKIYEIVHSEVQRLEIENKLTRKVRDKAEKNQQEYFLREKMRAIQEELNELNGTNDEDDETSILDKIENNPYPEHVKKKIRSELKRYETMPQSSLEASMEKTYIDWLVNLPWYQQTVDNDSLENVQRVLDEDHYGLEKVKERIVEYIAVKSMTNSLKAPILCLYGPPGVGKTSLAKSVARALERKFVKCSLGGVSDEAEIRGHRRTYVGAMPGKIIKGIKNANVNNPVFLLDEVDKVASSYKGDPASALLEVLDPEQNILFQDNYIEETFDLSNVLFIATANYLQNIPAPLRDRLELIELNSYTNFEKLNIAKRHLVAKQIKANGLTKSQIKFDDKALSYIIDFYTREAGVRNLERAISTCCRKAVVEIKKDPTIKSVHVTIKKVIQYLGTEIFDYSKKEKSNQVGVVTGLAYTEFGGDILPIEVNYFEGKGNLVITGNLGNVMKESASIALDYVKANAKKYEINPEFFTSHDIHIHVPEGAVPKDGPSAGIALTVAIISSITNTPVSSVVAMTGEVNLRGAALPIGGLKEKTLAALRSGIKTVVIPRENERNLQDLPREVKENLKIVLMDNVDMAVKEAFVK